jgi:hypothetical protein
MHGPPRGGSAAVQRWTMTSRQRKGGSIPWHREPWGVGESGGVGGDLTALVDGAAAGAAARAGGASVAIGVGSTDAAGWSLLLVLTNVMMASCQPARRMSVSCQHDGTTVRTSPPLARQHTLNTMP